MDTKGSEGKTEVEQASECYDNSPLKKRRGHCYKSPTPDIAEGFDAVLADANREIDALFSTYSKVLRERAAVDASQARELENILSEARNLESHLKKKKDLLKQTLASISENLHE